MKFCKPIKPIELFTDEELTDAWQCGGQHQFAIAIWERWQKRIVENAKLRAVVDALPRTADGVPIVPGMTLYSYSISGARSHVVSYGYAPLVWDAYHTTPEAAIAAKHEDEE